MIRSDAVRVQGDGDDHCETGVDWQWPDWRQRFSATLGRRPARRGPVRPFQSWPLRHRRLALSSGALGVVVPKSADDVRSAMAIAKDENIPVLPRGGGTSQCGQTVGEALVVDMSKHLNGVLKFDGESRSAWVEPGIVLDQLNAYLQTPRALVPRGRVHVQPRNHRRHDWQ